MKERDHSPECERAADLIAFIYNEDEHEAKNFELHLHECSSCREEAAAFGVVRESITTWRDEQATLDGLAGESRSQILGIVELRTKLVRELTDDVGALSAGQVALDGS